MRYQNRQFRVSIRTFATAIGVLLGSQPIALRAQSIVKPPVASPSEQSQFLAKPELVGRRFPCSHWIVQAKLIWPETRQQELSDCNYSWCQGTPGSRPVPCYRDDFLRHIDSNSAPICVVVHGAFYGLQYVVQQAPEFSGALRRLEGVPEGEGLNLVFLSWPSSVRCPTPSVTGTQSSQHGCHTLAPLLETYFQERKVFQGRKVCLIGHSYGARVVLSALHQVALNEAKDYYLRDRPLENRTRYRVALLAAAVDHHWLNPDQRYSLALPRAEKLLNVYNPYDYAMNLYSIRLPWAHEALGRSHFHNRDLDYITNDGNKDKIADAVDVSPFLGIQHRAPAYNIIQIGRAIRPLVYFDDFPTDAIKPEMRLPATGQTPLKPNNPRQTTIPTQFKPAGTPTQVRR